MKDTSGIGNRTTAKVLAALIDRYGTVFVPFGDGTRYDLLVDDAGKFTRIQCKTGSLSKGRIEFKNYSVTGRGSRPYGSDIDAYGVYCPQNKKTYLVPVGDCAKSATALRVSPAKNGMKKNIRWAENYEV